MVAIETRKLTKFYGAVPGIKNLDLSVNEGEVFGFIGPNGAGKSTTIRLLLNLIFPTSGTAKVLGLDAVNDSPEIKRQTGYLPAESAFYDKLTVKELIEYSAGFYGLKNWKKRRDKLAEALNLDLKRRLLDLSSGNKKKASILQALLHEPKLLILDEPTGGLDPLMQSTFYELIEEENRRGATVFFSSHVLSEVQRICSRAAIIRRGELVKIENIEDLKSKYYKKFTVHFAANTGEDFNLEGAGNLTSDGDRIKFVYSGDLNVALNYLSSFDVRNLSVEDPTLEEIFMHYYQY